MKVRKQPRIKGVRRLPAGSALLPEIKREIDFCAKHFRCSHSFVIATALADHFDIATEFRYDDQEGTHATRKKNRKAA